MSRVRSDQEVIEFLKNHNVFHLGVSLTTLENLSYEIRRLTPPSEIPWGDQRFEELQGINELLHYELSGMVFRPSEFLDFPIKIKVDCQKKDFHQSWKSNLGDGYISKIDEQGNNKLNFHIRLYFPETKYGENLIKRLGVWQKINQPYCDKLELDWRGVPIKFSLEFLESPSWRGEAENKRIGFYIQSVAFQDFI